MLHIMKKIADWIIEHEESEAEKCTIPDEIVDEWLDTIKEHKKHMEENHHTNSQQYEMLDDLYKRVRHIKKIRQQKCDTDRQR